MGLADERWAGVVPSLSGESFVSAGDVEERSFDKLASEYNPASWSFDSISSRPNPNETGTRHAP